MNLFIPTPNSLSCYRQSETVMIPKKERKIFQRRRNPSSRSGPCLCLLMNHLWRSSSNPCSKTFCKWCQSPLFSGPRFCYVLRVTYGKLKRSSEPGNIKRADTAAAAQARLRRRKIAQRFYRWHLCPHHNVTCNSLLIHSFLPTARLTPSYRVGAIV